MTSRHLSKCWDIEQMKIRREKLQIFTNEKIAWGANWPIKNQKGYFSGTKCQIDLKLGCEFKFFRCLEVNEKFINMDLGGILEGLFGHGHP